MAMAEGTLRAVLVVGMSPGLVRSHPAGVQSNSPLHSPVARKQGCSEDRAMLHCRALGEAGTTLKQGYLRVLN